MNRGAYWLAVVLGAAVPAAALAQLPATDPAAAASAASGAAASPAAAAAPKSGLFGLGLFGKTAEQRALCRVRFAESPAGQLLNNLLKPLKALTGGILKPVGEGQPNPENLKKPADSAQGAAAAIKAEDAQVKAKIADIEFLGKRDCRRYPEVEAALIAALRAEKSECVRLAAAKALLTGCCCTDNIVKALTVCVDMSTKDGNVAEESERVRLTAFLALDRCLRKCRPATPEQPPEKPPAVAASAEVVQTKYVDRIDATVYADARAVWARGISVSEAAARRSTAPANLLDMIAPPSSPTPAVATAPATPAATMPAAEPSKDRSLLGIVRTAATGR